jgi:hypothetical protein
MTCLLCGAPAKLALDLGRQPVSHRFPGKAGPETLHELAVGECESCGLAQLVSAPSEADIVVKGVPATFLEPEGHLDALADLLARGRKGSVAGATYKDVSLVERLERRGWKRALAGDKADLLVARHVLEHPRQPKAFLANLARRLTEGGRLALEVPDSARGFGTGDITTIWEEHTLYFTEATLKTALPAAGWKVERVERYPYALEDCLVAVVKPAPPHAPRLSAKKRAPVLGLLAAVVNERRRFWQKRIDSLRAGGKVAMLGAGHRGCAFVNYLGLARKIDFVVDDDPAKHGKLLPGSQRPIRGSDALAQAKLCLIAANPDAEPKILERHRAFAKAGGKFVSIYPGSKVKA